MFTILYKLWKDYTAVLKMVSKMKLFFSQIYSFIVYNYILMGLHYNEGILCLQARVDFFAQQRLIRRGPTIYLIQLLLYSGFLTGTWLPKFSQGITRNSNWKILCIPSCVLKTQLKIYRYSDTQPKMYSGCLLWR